MAVPTHRCDLHIPRAAVDPRFHSCPGICPSTKLAISLYSAFLLLSYIATWLEMLPPGDTFSIRLWSHSATESPMNFFNPLIRTGTSNSPILARIWREQLSLSGSTETGNFTAACWSGHSSLKFLRDFLERNLSVRSWSQFRTVKLRTEVQVCCEVHLSRHSKAATESPTDS